MRSKATGTASATLLLFAIIPAAVTAQGGSGGSGEVQLEERTGPGARLTELSDTPSSSETPLTGHWSIHRTDGPRAELELFWTDRTNWRHWTALSRLRGLSVDEIVSPGSEAVSFRIMEDAGTFVFDGAVGGGRGGGEFRFGPDRGFVEVLASLGVLDEGDASDHQLKNLAYGGIGAREIREFRDLGVGLSSLEEVLGLAVHHVSPEYVRAMRSLGVPDATGISEIVTLRMFGVTVEYVRDLASLGYEGLTGSQLVDLRRARVTPDFIRELRRRGHRDLSPEMLIDLKRRR